MYILSVYFFTSRQDFGEKKCSLDWSLFERRKKFWMRWSLDCLCICCLIYLRNERGFRPFKYINGWLISHILRWGLGFLKWGNTSTGLRGWVYDGKTPRLLLLKIRWKRNYNALMRAHALRLHWRVTCIFVSALGQVLARKTWKLRQIASTPRADKFRHQVRERDGICVITKVRKSLKSSRWETFHAAHILPAPYENLLYEDDALRNRRIAARALLYIVRASPSFLLHQSINHSYHTFHQHLLSAEWNLASRICALPLRYLEEFCQTRRWLQGSLFCRRHMGAGWEAARLVLSWLVKWTFRTRWLTEMAFQASHPDQYERAGGTVIRMEAAEWNLSSTPDYLVMSKRVLRILHGLLRWDHPFWHNIITVFIGFLTWRWEII